MLPEKIDITPVPAGLPSKSPVWWLAVLAALVCAMLMPRSSAFEYRFEPGRTWLYEDLVAPFNFLVAENRENTSPDAINPCYWLDPGVVHQQKQELSHIIQQQAKVSKQDAEFDDFNANLGAYRTVAMGLLDAVFRQGIIEKKPDQPNAIVLIPQSATRVSVLQTLTPAEAAEFLTDSLPYSPVRQPELLLPMMEKVLVPNVFYSDSLTLLYGHDSVEGGAGVVEKGAVLIKKGDRVDELAFARLTALKRAYDKDRSWQVRIGYALFSLIAFLSLFGWMFFFQPKRFANQKEMALVAVLVVAVVGLVLLTHWAGPAVPLLLPLYLLPLILLTHFNHKTALVIWSVPIMLTGFALSWGMLWVSIQAAGAGIGLLLNYRVNSWRDRILALLVIFAVQGLVWWSAVLAETAPIAMRNTDILVFLAIAAMLSISRSLLIRFFNAARR
jgi:cyclic-di-AMP phosphodiesterase PgpH